MSGRATFRVERSGLLLKVTPKERDELDRSLKICAWLQDSGFDAVAAPAQYIPAGPLRVRDGVWAAFWQWQDHDPESRPAPRETGELLKQLHELLSRCPIELPTLEPITADPRLPSLGEAAELDAAAVDFLATRYGSWCEAGANSRPSWGPARYTETSTSATSS